MVYKNEYYRKEGTYVNGHFITTKKSSITYWNNKGYLIFFPFFITLFSLISCSEDSGKSNCPTKTCSEFTTQSQAQSTYDSDRECYMSLDGDGDGRACENLPN